MTDNSLKGTFGSPLFGLAMAMVIIVLTMRKALGVVGMVFDALLMVILAVFAPYIGSRKIYAVIGFYMAYVSITFAIELPAAVEMLKLAYVSAPEQMEYWKFIGTNPLGMFGVWMILSGYQAFIMLCAFWGAKRYVKRKKIMERIGKVRTG